MYDWFLLFYVSIWLNLVRYVCTGYLCIEPFRPPCCTPFRAPGGFPEGRGRQKCSIHTLKYAGKYKVKICIWPDLQQK